MINIVGNSHVATMAGNLDHANIRRYSEIIDKINYIWDLDITCWNMSEKSLNHIKGDINHRINNNIIIFCYGSFDINNHLSIYKNTQSVVEKYYNLVLKVFADYKDMVYFMDPIPPIDNNDIVYTKEIDEYNIFIKSLDMVSTNRIRLSDIFKEGLTSKNLLDWRHLDFESNQKIALYLKSRFADLV